MNAKTENQTIKLAKRAISDLKYALIIAQVNNLETVEWLEALLEDAERNLFNIEQVA